jgi:hypothetical protein
MYKLKCHVPVEDSSRSIFPSNAFRYPKERCVSSCLHKSIVKLKINTEHWWNGSDTGKPKYWKKTLYHFCFDTDLTWTVSEPNPGLRGEGGH